MHWGFKFVELSNKTKKNLVKVNIKCPAVLPKLVIFYQQSAGNILPAVVWLPQIMVGFKQIMVYKYNNQSWDAYYDNTGVSSKVS